MSNLDEHYDAEVPFDDESEDIIEDVARHFKFDEIQGELEALARSN
jgi:hypothetical protein